MSNRPLVLVTGGAGFIGSHTVDALLRRNYRVRVVDNLDPQVHGEDATEPHNLDSAAEFIRGDVRDRQLMESALEDVDAVIHDAALVGVGQSQYQIEDYVSVNVGGTSILLDILANKRHKVRKLVMASSMSIYGEGTYRCSEHGLVAPRLRSDGQMDRRAWAVRCPHCGAPTAPVATNEDKELYCTSVYAQSKKDQEEYSLIVGRAYDIPTVAFRYFNVYGPRQSLSNPYTGVAAIFSSRIKNGEAPLIYEDGLQSRDFIHVSDIVQAKMIGLENPAARGAYNVGTGRSTSILRLAEALIDLYGASVRPYIVGLYRKGDIRDCYADITRLKALGYRPKVPLRDGLADLAAWAESAEAVDGVEKAHSELLDRGLVA